MKRPQTLPRKVGSSREGRFPNACQTALLGFCLVFGSIMSGACAVAPAVLVTSAVVSAAGVVTGVEDSLRTENTTDSVVVQDETAVYTGPGEGYSRTGTLGKGDKIKVLGYQEDWLQCSSDRFEIGWIHNAVVPDT